MKSPARAVLATLAFIATSLIALPAHAVGTQDQVAAGVAQGSTVINSTQALGQTFTAGRSGSLDRIAVDIQKNGSPGILNVAIFDVVSGSLSGSALATQSVADTGVSTTMSTISVDFASPATVVSGNQYAIVLVAPNAQSYNMMNPFAPTGSYAWSNVGNPLASETGFVSRTPWQVLSNDFAFITYVTPAQQAQTITWAPTNMSATTNATTLTPNTLATTNGDGAITYTVQDAGTTGCTLSNTPPSISFTSTGTCVIRANAAATAGYTAASLDVTFTISESLITPVVANSSLTTLADTGASSHLNWSLPLIGMGFVLAAVGVLSLRMARQRVH